MVEKKLREQRINKMKRVNSAEAFRQHYVDMMYRAPHERKLFRKRTYFK